VAQLSLATMRPTNHETANGSLSSKTEAKHSTSGDMTSSPAELVDTRRWKRFIAEFEQSLPEHFDVHSQHGLTVLCIRGGRLNGNRLVTVLHRGHRPKRTIIPRCARCCSGRRRRGLGEMRVFDASRSQHTDHLPDLMRPASMTA
jgi:hypothetical protein